MLKTSISNIRQFLNKTNISAREHIKRLHRTSTIFISRILPDIHTDITTTKQEIWTDPSHLYHKYDNPHQKSAFRKPLKEISYTINEDRKHTAYKRIYRTNNKTTPLQRTP